MKRIGFAALIGLGLQAAIWFLVPAGKVGPCGPIDTMACIKWSLLVPGLLVIDWLRLGPGHARLESVLLFLSPACLYAAIAWVALTVRARLGRKNGAGPSEK